MRGSRAATSIPGIYTVTNTVLGTVYVGQAVNIRKRWEVHRSTLSVGKHRNSYLQRAWSKYGPEAFRFEIVRDLSDVPKSDLAMRLNEEEIAVLLSFPETYNLMEAGRSGTIAGAETRAILSRLRKAIWADPTRRAHIVEMMRKRASDPEHQKRRGAALQETYGTPEARAKFSEHWMKVWADPAHQQEQSMKRRANWQEEAYREQQAASRRAAWADPQKRANRIAGLRAAWARRKAATAADNPPASD